MKIELRIRTIEMDALPDGVDTTALRQEIIGALETQILRNGLPTAHRVNAIEDSATTRDRGGVVGFGAEIATGIYKELGR